MNLNLLKKQLVADEGRKPRIYQDSVGKWSIGVGRDLSDVGLRDDEIDLMLSNDINNVIEQLQTSPLWTAIQNDDVRERAIINMGFNLGVRGLLSFRHMVDAIVDQRWDDAAAAMLDSLWAKQVGSRADRLAHMIKTGQDV